MLHCSSLLWVLSSVYHCSALLFSLLKEHRKHQKAARQSYVVMYRKYRDGELPDIQIKHSEIIRPLQALAQVS